MADAITRILVPVDFSPHSDHALQYAATLAGKVGAAVRLLHVVEDTLLTNAFTGEAYVALPQELLPAIVEQAGKRLVSLKDRVFPHGADVQTKVVLGRPSHSIVEQATDGAFDLIVMGTHGRSGFSHMFMGSVAERVVRTSPCAVLTVRGPGAAAAPGAAPKAA